MDSSKSFGELFRSLRYKAGFFTLKEFGDALAEKMIFYEDSIFSRWQSNSRIPPRRILLHIIQIFIDRKALTSFMEVNNLLATAGYGYLTEGDRKIISIKDDDSQLSVDNSFPLFENDIYAKIEQSITRLYEKIYNGTPRNTLLQIQNLKRTIYDRNLDKEIKGVALIQYANWVELRCYSDTSTSTGFKNAYRKSQQYLSFALEKNTQEIGPSYWMSSALLRLLILTKNPKKIEKSVVSNCLQISDLALSFTSEKNLEVKIVEHVEIGKIALILEDYVLFSTHFYKALSLVYDLPYEKRYLGALVWDLRARGVIKFGLDVDQSLQSIEEARKFITEDQKAINLYLENTEMQTLLKTNDKALRKRLKLLRSQLRKDIDEQGNPFQRMRFEKKEYLGM